MNELTRKLLPLFIIIMLCDAYLLVIYDFVFSVIDK